MQPLITINTCISVYQLQIPRSIMDKQSQILSLLDKQPESINSLIALLSENSNGSFSPQQDIQSIIESIKELLLSGHICDLNSDPMLFIYSKFYEARHIRRVSNLIDNRDSYLTLTTKGYFKQHPFLKQNT
jgi:hypothetical protein